MLIYHALQNPANQIIAKRGYVSKKTGAASVGYYKIITA